MTQMKMALLKMPILLSTLSRRPRHNKRKFPKFDVNERDSKKIDLIRVNLFCGYRPARWFQPIPCIILSLKLLLIMICIVLPKWMEMRAHQYINLSRKRLCVIAVNLWVLLFWLWGSFVYLMAWSFDLFEWIVTKKKTFFCAYYGMFYSLIGSVEWNRSF